jgi:hypothetical protein
LARNRTLFPEPDIAQHTCGTWPGNQPTGMLDMDCEREEQYHSFRCGARPASGFVRCRNATNARRSEETFQLDSGQGRPRYNVPQKSNHALRLCFGLVRQEKSQGYNEKHLHMAVGRPEREEKGMCIQYWSSKCYALSPCRAPMRSLDRSYSLVIAWAAS